MNLNRITRRAALAGATALPFATARAQGKFPARPIKLIIPWAAGGPADAGFRSLAESVSQKLGQPVVVENKGGAAGVLGALALQDAKPDGYTICQMHMGMLRQPLLNPQLKYDPIKDLTPVALIGVVPNVVVAGPQVAASNIKELVGLIKAKPGTFSCGSSGTGSTQHLACQAFALATGAPIVHIPYKGSAQALTDLVGGQIQMSYDTTSSAMSFIKSGKVKVLATMTTKRVGEIPEVPTLAESGVPGVEMSTWYGLFVTAGTPKEVVARLYAETAKIIQLPDVQKRLLGLGGEPGNLTSEQFGAMNRADFERFGKLIKDANIKIE